MNRFLRGGRGRAIGSDVRGWGVQQTPISRHQGVLWRLGVNALEGRAAALGRRDIRDEPLEGLEQVKHTELGHLGQTTRDPKRAKTGLERRSGGSYEQDRGAPIYRSAQ